MKTKLLFIILFTSSLVGFTQIVDSNNFDDLDIGIFADGIEPGQGGFLVSGNNGEAPSTTNNIGPLLAQVVASGENGTQGAQITSPDGDKGIFFLYKPITTQWASRESGKNVIQLKFSLFTGAATTSTAPLRATILGTNGTTNFPIISLTFDPTNNVLRGNATINVSGEDGYYSFKLGPSNTDLILPANTWYEVGCSYNTVTGVLSWGTSFNDTEGSFENTDNILPGLEPIELDFLSFPGASNASAVTYLFDDYRVLASELNTLSDNSSDLELEVTNLTLFPNPANNSVTLKTNLSIKEVTVTNTLGQIVLTKKAGFSKTNEFDISDFNAGFYVMSIKSTDGNIQTRKFLKK